MYRVIGPTGCSENVDFTPLPSRKAHFLSAFKPTYLMLPHEKCCADVGAQNGPVAHIRHASQREYSSPHSDV